MIILTEDEPLDFDMIIPISVSVEYMKDRRTELKIQACKSLEGIAGDFLKRYESNPLSAEARNFISEKLTEALGKSGFEPDKDALFDGTEEYILCDPKSLNRELILPNTVTVSQSDFWNYENLTCFEPDETPSYSNNFPVFAAVENGKLLSVAAVNGFPSGGIAEISADTADAFRGRGLAASAVSKAAEYLPLHGHAVRYVTFESNSASSRLAKKCGFDLRSVGFDGVCFRK